MAADTIATLSRRIRAVARERAQLRTASAGRAALERNRLELAELQRRLAAAVAHDAS